MMSVQIYAVLLSLFFLKVCIAQEIVLQVAVISRDLPVQVHMQEEEGIQNIAFEHNEAEGTYSGRVVRPNYEIFVDSKKLTQDYRLIASWVDNKEQLFLKIHTQLPDQIKLKLYHNQESFNNIALDKIESLCTDLESLIEKYCRARAFHMHWRFEMNQPANYIALRSAKVWFDAAVALALRRYSPFRMDADIVKIMNDYEEKARHDDKFNSRYRQYVRVGYVSGMLDEVKTADYAFVGLIPSYVAEGRHQEAYELNSKAYTALSDAPESTQKLVETRQGVNLELLRSNAAFLSTKAGL